MAEKWKDFIWRSQVKKKIESSNPRFIVKKRQIWLYYIWENIWNEASKKHPFIRPWVVINENFRGDLILIWPLTTKQNTNLSDIYLKIDGERYGLDKDSYIMINQIKPISKKRLIRKFNDDGKYPLIDNSLFMQIVEKIKNKI